MLLAEKDAEPLHYNRAVLLEEVREVKNRFSAWKVCVDCDWGIGACTSRLTGRNQVRGDTRKRC